MASPRPARRRLAIQILLAIVVVALVSLVMLPNLVDIGEVWATPGPAADLTTGFTRSASALAGDWSWTPGGHDETRPAAPPVDGIILPAAVI